MHVKCFEECSVHCMLLVKLSLFSLDSNKMAKELRVPRCGIFLAQTVEILLLILRSTEVFGFGCGSSSH